jgi:hypothetical protein
MRINQKLNFLIPIDRDDGTLYVHCAPLHREVFERYFMVLSQTFTAIYGQGISLISGPRVAALLLRQIATANGEWDGPEGVEAGLMGEIRRLSNMIINTPQGWQTVPLYDALKEGRLDEDEAAEVEGVMTFFIVASAMHKRSELPAILAFAGKTWGALTSSLNSTDFAASLPTLTPDAVTAAKATASLIPS